MGCVLTPLDGQKRRKKADVLAIGQVSPTRKESTTRNGGVAGRVDKRRQGGSKGTGPTDDGSRQASGLI